MQGTIFIIVGSVLLVSLGVISSELFFSCLSPQTIVSVYKILLYKQKHPAGPLHLGTKVRIHISV